MYLYDRKTPKDSVVFITFDANGVVNHVGFNGAKAVNLDGKQGIRPFEIWPGENFPGQAQRDPNAKIGGFLGILPTPAIEKDTQIGFHIERIARDSPASASDLRVGDVILALDGKPVANDSTEAFIRRVTAFKAEQTISVTVKRIGPDGKADQRDINVKLGSRRVANN